MSIDFSVLIWTVICFLLMMVILQRLLFKPIRTFMKERQAQIDEGIAAGAQAKAALAQQQLALQEQVAEKQNAIQQSQKQIEVRKLQLHEQAAEEAESHAIHDRELLQAGLDEEEEELLRTLSENNPAVILQLTRKLGIAAQKEAEL